MRPNGQGENNNIPADEQRKLVASHLAGSIQATNALSALAMKTAYARAAALRVAFKNLLSLEDLQDITTITAAKAIASIDRHRYNHSRGSFTTYVATIARNETITRIRQNKIYLNRLSLARTLSRHGQSSWVGKRSDIGD